MKTIYNTSNKKTYLITNAPIEIGRLVVLPSQEIVEIRGANDLMYADALGGKVLKETKPMSPYIYPGLPMALFM